MYGIVQDIMRDEFMPETKTKKNIDETSWDDLFPESDVDIENTDLTLDEDIDITQLKPDDPRFLGLPWPNRAGPEAAAYSKHIQWRRSLSDGERLRWQKWAVYKRMAAKHDFTYTVEDYVYQVLLRQLDNKLQKAVIENNMAEATMWHAVKYNYIYDEEKSVKSTMKAFYTALNKQNYDDLRCLWLPTEDVEMVLPGYEKEVILSHTIYNLSHKSAYIYLK